MSLDQAYEICKKVIDQVSKVIVGKSDVLKKVMICIMCNGHLLIEDYPGLAKTLMAKTFAAALGCKFKRVQFTPDLLPADITGTYVYNQKTSEFELRKGPIFTNILLADEINRSPPRTQSALLEAMQEKQVTLDGVTHKLEEPFVVIATQNPIELEGTYPLAEAQLDRFMMRISVGYPSKEEEKTILIRRIRRGVDEIAVEPVADAEAVIKLQQAVERVHVDDDVLGYIVDLIQSTRKQADVEVGASPRASVMLMKLCRALALLKGRDFVTPDDVKSLAYPTLNHRIILKPESSLRGRTVRSIIERVLLEIPVPKV